MYGHVSNRLKKEAVPRPPPLVVYGHPKTTKRFFIQAALKLPTIHEGPYMYPHTCRRPHCNTCAHIKCGNRLSSLVKGNNFELEVPPIARPATLCINREPESRKRYVGRQKMPFI